MGSLLRVFYGKEVGERKWCETFAGPLVRRLSRAGGLRFIFSKEMLICLCFFLCFSGAPEHKKKHKKKHNSYHKKKHQKKTQFIPQKEHKKQKTQFIPHKKPQFIPQKKHQKKHNSYHKKSTKKKLVSFFSASVSAFFCFLCFFCFWKVAAFKALSISQPGPAPAPLSPSAPQPPGSAPRPCPGSVQQPRPLYVFYTHILLFCYGRCDGQHPKP